MKKKPSSVYLLFMVQVGEAPDVIRLTNQSIEQSDRCSQILSLYIHVPHPGLWNYYVKETVVIGAAMPPKKAKRQILLISRLNLSPMLMNLMVFITCYITFDIYIFKWSLLRCNHMRIIFAIPRTRENKNINFKDSNYEAKILISSFVFKT